MLVGDTTSRLIILKGVNRGASKTTPGSLLWYHQRLRSRTSTRTADVNKNFTPFHLVDLDGRGYLLSLLSDVDHTYRVEENGRWFCG